MDDNKTNPNENQSLMENQIVPEEIAPDVANPTSEEIGQEAYANQENLEQPPPVYEENKNKYIFIALAVIIFIVLLLIFLGVFRRSTTGAKEITLTYWSLWEEKEVIMPLINEYNKKFPNIKIDYQTKAKQEYRERLIARSKNGQGPDIFRFHNTWLPEISEVAAPLPSSIMSNADFEATYYKIHQKDLKIGNYYYGLPLEIDGLILLANELLLKKGGVEKVPTSWEELIEVAAKLTVKSGDQIVTSGIALGTASNIEHFSEILGLMITQNGGSIKNLEAAEAVEALQSYRRFAEPPNNFWDEQMPNSVTAFIQEKVAMIFVPSWQILTIKSINPDLKIKAGVFPTMVGVSPVSLASYWVEGVSKFSPNQIEAWKFIKFLSEKENLTKLYENQSKIRLFGEPYSRVDLAQLLIQNEYVGPVIKQGDMYVSMPVAARTFDNGLNDEIIKYLENAVNATVSGISYGEAFRVAKQGIDQVLTKYKIEP